MKICKKGLHEYEGHYCKECKKHGKKIWQKANLDKCNINSKLWQKTNPDKVRAIKKEWQEVNSERQKELEKTWRKANPERIRIWAKANPDKRNANEAKRRASKLNATPKWLTKEHFNEIEQLYKKSKELEKETGIKHQVDHIMPLRGKTVSGLHVPWNLRVVTAEENIKKSNKIKAE